MARVTVNQIGSDRKPERGWTSFMNVEEEYGYVNVWGCAYEKPTYILTKGINWMVIQFDEPEYRDAWMSEQLQYWNVCIDLVNKTVVKNEKEK